MNCNLNIDLEGLTPEEFFKKNAPYKTGIYVTISNIKYQMVILEDTRIIYRKDGDDKDYHFNIISGIQSELK